MLLEFSHILAFSALFISGLFDIFSEKGDVPSVFMVAAVIGGILLHSAYAFTTGSITPFTWMIVIGAVFSLYGWVTYWMGMWGGADAMAMTVLGFASPYSIQGIGVYHSLSLFINIFLVSTVYAVGFAGYKAFTSPELKDAFIQRISSNRRLVAAEFALIAVFSRLQSSLTGSLLFFTGLSLMILFYHLTKELENVEMSKTVSLEEVEAGDVIDTEELDLGRSRQRSLVGNVFEKLDGISGERLSETPLNLINERMGYSEIVGVTEEELEHLKEKEVQEVQINEGLRLVPVFPAALLLTDAGLTVLTYLTFL